MELWGEKRGWMVNYRGVCGWAGGSQLDRKHRMTWTRRVIREVDVYVPLEGFVMVAKTLECGSLYEERCPELKVRVKMEIF